MAPEVAPHDIGAKRLAFANGVRFDDDQRIMIGFRGDASPILLTCFTALLLCACGGQQTSPCPDGSPDCSVDAIVPDDTSFDAVLGEVTDAVEAGDTGMPAPGALGAPCMQDSDCHSGICLSIGRCSQPCAGRVDCPQGPNWSCAGIPGRGTICNCVPQGTSEIPCNGVDDDCDGVIDPGSATCNGMCTDISSSNSNCGSCGIACTGGSTCQHGACSCPPERPDVCGTSCVNTRIDPMHCGSCSTTCPPAANATPACVSGGCGATCLSGFGNCDGSMANGCESDLRSNPANCGMCGHACSFAHASATCTTGTCVMGACDAGYADCNGSTLDGCEVAVATDTMNCGTCGRTCNAANATSACTAGMCSLVGCTSGFGDCDGSAADGCEVNLQSDPNNCSVCGGSCPMRANAARTCTTGTCGFTCFSGFADCDGVASTGCETATSTDPNNCGACSNRCTAGANETVTCGGGMCHALCTFGFGDCDGSAATGCETNLMTNVSSCGSCGYACNLPNATAQCISGTCAVASCATGYADCDGIASNGCETNLNNDPFHCGACATTCPGATAPNTMATCTATVCGISCATGFADCDANLANGCETDIRTTSHCGSCSNACGPTQVCNLGVCGCPAGQMPCGAGGACVDTTSDPNNCGGCGIVCGAGLSCISGMCSMTIVTYHTVAPPPSVVFVDVCSTPGALVTNMNQDDGMGATYTMPFVFALFDGMYTQVTPSADGYLGFGATGTNFGVYGSFMLPGTTTPHPAFFAYSRDLFQRAGGTCFTTIGSAPNRSVAWETNDAYHYGDATTHLTFEVFLNEGSNTIDVIYQTLTGAGTDGSQASVGMLNATNAHWYQYEYDMAGSLMSGLRVRFVPN